MWKIWLFVKIVKKKIMTHLFKLIALALIPVLIYSKDILSYVTTQLAQMKSAKSAKSAKLAKSGKTAKIVVFDLDETLGYFTELSIFWDALEQYYGHNLFNDKFFELLDVFPEVFRPNMLSILNTLRKKKERKACQQIFIYTNNQGPKSWVTMLSDYINLKLGTTVFDRVIAAYKIRGKQIEPQRTSHEKSVSDLIRCTNIPANAEICFIDDLYHPLMDKDNVYYINIKPYRVSIPFEEMATRYYDAVLSSTQIDKNDFVRHIVAFMRQFNYMLLKKSAEEEAVDTIVSKKLLADLEDFLKCERSSNTRKRHNRRVKSMRKYF
jgi:hypothetical protein